MAIDIGIPEKNRESVARILNDTLADEYVLYTKTRNYHWNVVGTQFNDFHKFFESQYEELNEIVDEVAERVRALGEWSRASLAEFTQSTRLKEHPGQYSSAEEMVSNLLSDHEALIRTLRGDQEACAETYEDMGTNDFLIGLMERHEKMAWMLRSILESPSKSVGGGRVAIAKGEEFGKDEPLTIARKTGRRPRGSTQTGPGKTKGAAKRPQKGGSRARTTKSEEPAETDATVLGEDEPKTDAREPSAPEGEPSGAEESDAGPSLEQDEDPTQ